MFPQIFGKYVLEREIAAGGMAVVYLATLRGAGGFEKRLVVKQIRAELATDEAFVHRFVEEAKTTVELSHPNIVPVYELGVEQGVYYIAMELAEGLTLGELLEQEGPLSAEEGAYLGVEVCRALDYAHRRAGVVHRDVTPRNVLVDEEGAVRLIDFGIAAPVRPPTGDVRLAVFGSLGHMPAEQMRGERLTPATDVFAVAALLVEAWSGRAPFRRRTVSQTEQALREPLESLSAHDPKLAPLEPLLSEAVAYDQQDRPQTAEELARPLREFLRPFDLGDLARRLGRRVERGCRLRGSTEPAVATSSRAIRPGESEGDSPANRTFAATKQLTEWTRQLPETGMGAESDEAGGAPADPLKRRSAAGRWRPRAAALAVALLLAAGLVALLWPRADEGAANGSSRPAVAVAGAAASVSSSVVAKTEPDGAVRGAPPAQPAPAVPVSAAGLDPALSRGDRTPSGTLALTSDLPAHVRLGSRTLGVTPRRVDHAAGPVRVVFESVELGERIATTVVVPEDTTLGVHAEFTRARPAVRLRR